MRKAPCIFNQHIINNLKIKVMSKSLFLLIRLAYKSILRPLVVDKIKASPTQIDDFCLGVLDKLFNGDDTSA